LGCREEPPGGKWVGRKKAQNNEKVEPKLEMRKGLEVVVIGQQKEREF